MTQMRVVFMSQTVRSSFTPVASQPRSCVEAVKHFFALRGSCRWRGEARAHRAEEDRGHVAPVGDELVGLRPVAVELHHRGDDPVGRRLLALGQHLVDGGRVGDRLGDDVQLDAELLRGLGHGLDVLGLEIVEIEGQARPTPCMGFLGAEEEDADPRLGAGRRGVGRQRPEPSPNRPDCAARADSPTVVIKSRRSIDRQQPQAWE